MNIPSGQSPHHLQCIQSKLYKDSQLLAGPRAGHYTDVGPISNVHTCTRLCCEDASCDVAYMFGKNCFMVKCYDEKGCRVVSSKPHGDMSGQASKNGQIHKTVQYIVKRKFGVAVRQGKPLLHYFFIGRLGNHSYLFNLSSLPQLVFSFFLSHLSTSAMHLIHLTIHLHPSHPIAPKTHPSHFFTNIIPSILTNRFSQQSRFILSILPSPLPPSLRTSYLSFIFHPLLYSFK